MMDFIISLIGGVTGSGACITVDPETGYTELLNMNTMLLSWSGTGKSPVVGVCESSIQYLTHLINRKCADVIEEGSSSESSTGHSISEGTEPAQASKKGSDRRYVMLNTAVTIEALHTNLIYSQKYFGVAEGFDCREEASTLYDSLNQYRGGKGTDEADLLCLMDEKNWSRDTVKAMSENKFVGSTEVTNPKMIYLGAAHPDATLPNYRQKNTSGTPLVLEVILF